MTNLLAFAPTACYSVRTASALPRLGLLDTGETKHRMRKPFAGDGHPSLLTVEQFASRLNVEKSWVYDRTGPKSVERIPCFKFGHYVRLDDPLKPQTEEMREWVQQRLHRPNSGNGRATKEE